jgi:Mg2+/Co2+ transporter CorB
MSKPVLLLMYLLAPIAWPTAKLLDKLLGEDHGTVYKKSGLKTLVTLHKSLGDVSERLNQDEVTIISAVLDLKEKPVGEVMTPMDDVFVMAEDTVLDEKTMDMILSAGYSRIPIHETGNPTNFVGMLLVKILITYDPEDSRLVRDFPLATLPETSCLDIVNFFQEGKSHMVLVSEYPGEDHGALGVVTLEDVIEELIGEQVTIGLACQDRAVMLTNRGTERLSTSQTSTLTCTKQSVAWPQLPRRGFNVGRQRMLALGPATNIRLWLSFMTLQRLTKFNTSGSAPLRHGAAMSHLFQAVPRSPL